MKDTLTNSKLHIEGAQEFYKGKVRDVYFRGDNLMVVVTTDRISAFDVVLPIGIPYKGQVLNQIASTQLDAVRDIVPIWKVATPDPMVTVGHRCTPFKVEMVIRGYITGSAWRAYEKGERKICGIELPSGLKKNQRLDRPIITPTTKAEHGHDENISREEIIKKGIVSEEDYKQLESLTYRLFERGTEIAEDRGLILVDTKYEFGKKDGKIFLIDEIHTPDSSRFFYRETYEENFRKGEAPRELSKEFVRQWLIENGFSGQEGQKIPHMDTAFAQGVSERYIELYEKFLGHPFQAEESINLAERIEKNVNRFLATEK